VYHVSLSLSRACVFALALGSATASCTFNPSGQVGGPDGSTEPRPDADPLRPDADPGAPDARPVDARVDSPDASVPPDAQEGCASWTPRPTHFNPCDLPSPSPALNLTTNGEYLYNTDTVTLRDPVGNVITHASRELPGNPPVVAISVEGLLVGNVARLRVIGSKPLLVASWSEITVDGLIDVSSDLSRSGAGASTGDCDPSGAGGQGNNGGGGGGGGGFGGDGGGGGAGEGGGNGGNPGGVVAKPSALRGGCAGARGGRGDGGDSGGAGGAGGGVLQLTAQVRIGITGRLHAGGSGGGGANGPAGRRSGGGGGGSGGLIDLEAPAISFGPGAIVAANGGGGGEGTEDQSADFGLTGRIDNTPAEGGSGNSGTGGDGGNGSAGTERDGETGSPGTRGGPARGGGGGGGGGAGFIIIDGTESVAGGAVLSPQPVDR
jgi:hypothetical protein